MNEDPKHHDEEEIIELTEVLDEDQLEEEDLDEELRDFLADTEDDETQSRETSGDDFSTAQDSDFDSFFDREEAGDELNKDWTFPDDGEEQRSAFQDSDLDLDQEDFDHSDELESMFADLDEHPKAGVQKEKLEERIKETNTRLDEVAEELQELRGKLEDLPAAAALHSLVQEDESPGDQEVSREAEGVLLEKTAALAEEKSQEKTDTLRQELLEKMTQLENRLSALSEGMETLKKEQRTLTGEMITQEEFEELKKELREEFSTEIRQAVPKAAAEIIRGEIRKMQGE